MRLAHRLARWYDALVQNDKPPPERPYRPYPMLTPEECQRIADATRDLPYPLLASTQEIIEEEVHGKPMDYGTTAAAIAAMERRLADQRAAKAQLLDTLADCSPSLRRQLDADLVQLNAEISDTQTRLDDYRRQQGQGN